MRVEPVDTANLRYRKLGREGWVAGDCKPSAPGVYERCTPKLGITVDAWDGKVWRRLGHEVDPYVEIPFRGVICANQNLPWRPTCSR